MPKALIKLSYQSLSFNVYMYDFFPVTFFMFNYLFLTPHHSTLLTFLPPPQH